MSLGEEARRDEAGKKAGGNGRARWVALLALLAGIILAYALGLADYLTLSSLIRQDQVLHAFVADNFLAAMGLYAVVYILTVALSIPGASVLTIAGGYLFGWVVSGSLAVFSATAGAVLIFIVARSSIGEFLRRKAGGWLTWMRKGFQESAFSYLLFLRLTPVFPFWLVNVAPALLGVSLPVYTLATVLGIVPGTFAFAIVGTGLGSLIEAQEEANPGCADAGTCNIDLSALVTPTLVAALFALGLLALIAPIMKKLRQRRAGE